MEEPDGQSTQTVTPTTSTSSMLSGIEKSNKAPLSAEFLQKIERNRRAAQEKRKATMLALEEETQSPSTATATTSIVNVAVVAPPLPKPKRQKTEEEILREAELKDVVSHGQVVRVQGYKVIDTGGIYFYLLI